MQPVTRSLFTLRALAALGASLFACSAAAQHARLELLTQLEIGTPTEIAAYDQQSGHVLVTLADPVEVLVIDVSDRRAPHALRRIGFADVGGAINSVACHNGLFAVALTAEPSTDPGLVVFFDGTGHRTKTVRVGAMPDMVTFTPDGKYALTANEGEPAKGIDPEGSVSLIDLSDDSVRTVALSDVKESTDATWMTPPEAMPASLIEPEYIAVTPDSRSAYVVCQENNAVAVIDLERGERQSWHWLGTSKVGGMDALRQPDTIIAFDTPAGLRIVTANEGDPRDEWGDDGVAEYEGNDVVASILKAENRPVRFGAQSISLYDASMQLLDDSGDAFARRIDAMHQEGIVDDRTVKIIAKRDDKRGVEPEGLAHTRIGDTEHIFVGLERAGMVAHLTCSAPYDTLELIEIVQIDTPDTNGHLASPEGLLALPGAGGAPPTLVVTDEVHGTLTFFAITQTDPTSKP
ncbi:MAG: choice-of-anchor I domain-containing protein [Phycisphaerales bacterium JB061]